MPKDDKPKVQAAPKKECPNCKATIFQGPVTRGEIVDGAFVVRETLYQCVTCHAVKPIEQLNER